MPLFYLIIKANVSQYITFIFQMRKLRFREVSEKKIPDNKCYCLLNGNSVLGMVLGVLFIITG